MSNNPNQPKFKPGEIVAWHTTPLENVFGLVLEVFVENDAYLPIDYVVLWTTRSLASSVWSQKPFESRDPEHLLKSPEESRRIHNENKT